MTQEFTDEQKSLLKDIQEVYRKHDLMLVPILHAGATGILPVMNIVKFEENALPKLD